MNEKLLIEVGKIIFWGYLFASSVWMTVKVLDSVSDLITYYRRKRRYERK